MSVSQGLLSGVKVLDLTSVLAGPHATRLLVGLGASVTKVENPHRPDPGRGFGPICVDDYGGFFLQQNVGKELLALDWTSERGAALMRRIASSFDVIVDDSPPGLLESLGLGFEELSQSRALIQCSITPFGLHGRYAGRPGDGLSSEAMAAIHSVTGYPDLGPQPLGFMFGEFTAGSYAVASIVAALIAKARWGHGRHIDVSAFDSLLAIHDSSLPEYNWTKGSVLRTRPGSDREVLVPYGIYPGQDGYIAIVATSNTAFAQLAAAIGQPDWAGIEQYFTQAGRAKDRDRIRQGIVDWLSSLPSVWEAERLLASSGVIAAVVRDVPNVVSEGLLQGRSLLAHVTDGSPSSSIPTLNTPFHFRDAPSGLDGCQAPGPVGRDSRSILGRLGFSPLEVEQLLEDGLIATWS